MTREPLGAPTFCDETYDMCPKRGSGDQRNDNAACLFSSDEAHTVSHKIGRMIGLDHDDGGNMAASGAEQLQPASQRRLATWPQFFTATSIHRVLSRRRISAFLHRLTRMSHLPKPSRIAREWISYPPPFQGGFEPGWLERLGVAGVWHTPLGSLAARMPTKTPNS